MTEKIFKALFILTVVFLLVSSAPKAKAQACAWGDGCTGALLGHMLDVSYKQMQGAILGALKQAALQTINSTYANLISQGNSGQALFITNWQNFLYQQPYGQARVALNDFFTQTTRGRSSAGSYLPSAGGSLLGGGSINYEGFLVNNARSAIDQTSGPAYVTMGEYTSNPANMFQGGSWRPFVEFYSNPLNTPAGYQMAASNYYQSTASQLQNINSQMGQSYGGYLPKMSGGMVITPGSTIEGMFNNVQDLGNKILAAANNVPEIMTAMVTRLATKTITSGIGMVQRQVQSKINNTVNGYGNQMRQAVQNASPAAVFKPRY